MTRQDIVSKAREYLGTPFQHQGRIKGRACDCIGLPLMVAHELKLRDRFGVLWTTQENAGYSSQPLDAKVHTECQRRLIERPIPEMEDGDILTLRLPSVPCHVAIVTTVNGVRGMLHAYNGGAEKVCEHVIDARWMARIAGCFSFPEVV